MKRIKEKINEELELMIKSIKFNNPGISEEILEAFRICDRKFFVKENVYADMPQHVAHGQTISQPSTIARMIRLLRLESGIDVLEVGANTGYHASLVAWLVWPGKVVTIEIFPDLAEMARKNVKTLIKYLEKTNKQEAKKFTKIEVVAGDALDPKTKIWKQKYDRIYFTAGVESDKINEVKKMGKELLKENGLLLYPTREAYDWGALEIWQLHNGKLKLILREAGYSFVPLLKKEELEELYRKR
ncbi:MAG: hypothetical protein QXK80_00005 [Candidatus Pacearchaeota archaeon]